MARIKIEDLALLEDLPQDEQKAILGGNAQDNADNSGLLSDERITTQGAQLIIGL